MEIKLISKSTRIILNTVGEKALKVNIDCAGDSYPMASNGYPRHAAVSKFNVDYFV